MRVLISSDSHRGVMTGLEVTSTIAEGLQRSIPTGEFVRQAIADGGEGTTDVLVKHFNGTMVSSQVTGLLGDRITAPWGLIKDGSTAVIEISAASGVETLAVHRRDPMRSTSYGTGELIKKALMRGCTRILLGLGGSGTVDGGLGLLEALGYRFLDAGGRTLPRGGMALAHLTTIDASKADSRLNDAEIIVLCDIDTPIFFDNSSIAKMFGPQKGADPASIELLDIGLKNLISAVEKNSGISIGFSPFDGASGAAAGAMKGILGARLVSGIDTVLDLIDFKDLAHSADFIISGEGCIDRQTLYGKAPLGVARAAQRQNTPVFHIAGRIANDIVPQQLANSRSILTLYTQQPVFLEHDAVRARLIATAERLGKRLLRGQIKEGTYGNRR